MVFSTRSFIKKEKYGRFEEKGGAPT